MGIDFPAIPLADKSSLESCSLVLFRFPLWHLAIIFKDITRLVEPVEGSILGSYFHNSGPP